MKTIKELTEEAIAFFNNDDSESATTTKEIIPVVLSALSEEQLDDENYIGLVGGYVECAYSLQPEIEHFKNQYNVKCNEKRNSDHEIERLTRIIIDGGLGSKLEID